MHTVARSSISKSRLEFLFDGFFAIAMTLLVLELRVPELADRHSVTELARGLAQYATTFGSYLLSFIVLGAFWYRHNHQYHWYERITPAMMVLHFVQLAMAAFFPFCAALFGRYPFNPLAALIYVSCIMTYLWASVATWVVAYRAGATVAELGHDEYRRRTQRMLRRMLVVTALFAYYLFRTLAR